MLVTLEHLVNLSYWTFHCRLSFRVSLCHISSFESDSQKSITVDDTKTCSYTNINQNDKFGGKEQITQNNGDLALAEYARVGRAVNLYEVGDRAEAILEMEDMSLSLKGYPGEVWGSSCEYVRI